MSEIEKKLKEEREILEEFNKLDPVERFHVLAELRAQGIDPVEIGLIPGNPVTKKVPSGDKMATKLINRATVAAEEWVQGIKNPSRNPIEAALDAKDKWADRLNQAIKDGKWEAGLKKTSHAEIVSIVEKLGADVFTKGLEARESKIKKVFNELQPLFQSVSDTIQSMPNKTDADREKRLLQARKLMIELGKKRRGGS
jgi:hypothetical protein